MKQLPLRSLLGAALIASMMAVSARISFPLPWYPLPLTLQVFFMMLGGLLLGPWAGASAQLAYIALGLLGAPVFSVGGGPGYVLTPGFGYLLGFVACAFICGKLGFGGNFRHQLVACLCGLGAMYLIALPYQLLLAQLIAKQSIALGAVLGAGPALYLPMDIAKALAAAGLGARIHRQLRKPS